jgi:hypothetical protein
MQKAAICSLERAITAVALGEPEQTLQGRGLHLLVQPARAVQM